MPNYTKLFNSIVTSTIWTEDDKTRIVWITMLAMADQNGEVHASIPGLARLSAVTLEDVESAIDKLISPDKYSRTPDHEGRRIEKIDGGWELLNHAKYRLMASREDAKAANAARQRRYRERNASVTDSNASVTDSNGECENVTQGLHIAEAEAEAEVEVKISPTALEHPSEARPTIGQQAELIWKEYPRKIGKEKSIAAIKRELKTRGYIELVNIVKEFAVSVADKDKEFIPHGSTYFCNKRYNDEIERQSTQTEYQGSLITTDESGQQRIGGREFSIIQA